MNEYDSDRIGGILQAHGWNFTSDERNANLIILNTCSVRKKAEDKVLSKLGRLRAIKESNPDLVIGVCGCMAQREGRVIFEKAPQVDFILGPQSIKKLPEIITKTNARISHIVETGIFTDCYDDFCYLKDKGISMVKSYVSIMEGCDNFCTFCVVPYARGRERSREYKSILKEIENRVKEGCKEITLLGQNVNSYGKGTAENLDFADLLEIICQADGLKRIRFVTSNPRNFTSKIIKVMAANKKICRQLHLPLQSGSDRILKLMNRGYTLKLYLDLVSELKSHMPDISLSTDIIVGFPSENEDDFQQTLYAMKEVEFDSFFSFRYSPREGTVAASFENQISDSIKQRRLTELNSTGNEITTRRSNALIGKTMSILVDSFSKKNSNEMSGRTQCNRIVNFNPLGKELCGKIINIKITQSLPHCFRGELI